MADVISLLGELDSAEQTRAYVLRLDLLEIGDAFLKARLYVDVDLFVQVYRNDKFGTTNLALIQGERRIYARDELAGKRHRHPADDPEAHNTSEAGQTAVTLSEFLDEVEMILTERDLL